MRMAVLSVVKGTDIESGFSRRSHTSEKTQMLEKEK